MAKWALIQDGRAHWVFEAEAPPESHPSLVYVPCPDDVQEGDRYDAERGTFTRPMPPPAPTPATSEPAPPLGFVQPTPVAPDQLQTLKIAIDAVLAEPKPSVEALVEVLKQWRRLMI